MLIGHAGHPEVVGTLGQLPDGAITLVQTVEEAEAFQPRDASKLSYVTQTTLSLDDTAGIVAALKRRFPAIVAPHKEDICYATTNRQEAVKRVAPQVDALVVVGAPNSSNSRRLQEVAERAGCPYSVLVQRAAEIDWSKFEGIKTLGVTAGASAPEVLVEEILDAFAARLHAERRDRLRRGRIRHVLPAAAPASRHRGGVARFRNPLDGIGRRRAVLARMAVYTDVSAEELGNFSPATTWASCCPTRASRKASRIPISSSTPAPATTS